MFLGTLRLGQIREMEGDVCFIREGGPLMPRTRLVKDSLFSRGNERT